MGLALICPLAFILFVLLVLRARERLGRRT